MLVSSLCLYLYVLLPTKYLIKCLGECFSFTYIYDLQLLGHTSLCSHDFSKLRFFQLDGDQKDSLPSLGKDSVSSAHATIFSAANVGGGYMLYA